MYPREPWTAPERVDSIATKAFGRLGLQSGKHSECCFRRHMRAHAIVLPGKLRTHFHYQVINATAPGNLYSRDAKVCIVPGTLPN